ncbi:hypothetical protein VO64_0195 [Pseudomonas synxantha]|uniref:Uncharacterized protein n=1 Tax=Pseudomonas synxantha TaxID=47883 RepID=A0AAU8TJF2_9PSED|nr:hypothetical protein VO64_0195 [Pseudomonas synxantha]
MGAHVERFVVKGVTHIRRQHGVNFGQRVLHREGKFIVSLTTDPLGTDYKCLNFFFCKCKRG